MTGPTAAQPAPQRPHRPHGTPHHGTSPPRDTPTTDGIASGFAPDRRAPRRFHRSEPMNARFCAIT
ncbi:hypothetical protein DVS28_a3872 [Euzebya pacifica]|uniref:Uncharacterized protein n=1 Tax=Euzebya pacifica TaxID=1608957 RepID=A0A346Y247_9ACTN|nr:hypothetical protein DVS28_a3872 [Euzebya pacifica]